MSYSGGAGIEDGAGVKAKAIVQRVFWVSVAAMRVRVLSLGVAFRRHDSANSLTRSMGRAELQIEVAYRCEVYLDEVWFDVAIQAFARKEIEAFFLSGRLPRGEGWASSASIAKRKLDMLDYAAILNDLASPPGNRLEALKGDLKGLHSIRINDQWRIIFRWTADGPDKVDICDYH